MAEPTPPKPVLPWRQEPSPKLDPGRLRPGARRAVYALVVLMLIVGAIVVGLLSWIRPVPNPEFIPLWVTQYRSRHVPFPAGAQNDRLALHRAAFFPRWTEQPAADGERHTLKTDLRPLAQLGERDTAVVYVSAQAVRDAKGAVVVLPADADPDQLETGLPLREILDALHACPAQHQLLILDIMRPVASPRLGVLVADVAAGVEEEVRAADDPRLLVLGACAPGQVSLSVEAVGRSVFGYYVEEGLRGWADGYGAGGKRDGHVSARELAAFVRARVDRWAVRNRGTRQTPTLLGSARDFLLHSLEYSKPEGHVAEPALPTYPKALLTAWQKLDKLWQDGAYRLAPHHFRQAQALVLQAERAWRGEATAGAVEADQLAAFEALQGEIAQARVVPHPEPQSLALATAFGQAGDPALDKALRALRPLLQEVSEPKPELAAKERLQIIKPIRAKIEGLPAFTRGQAVFELAAAEEEPTPDKLVPLEALLRHRTELLPRFVETLVLRRLADLAARTDGAAWPTATVRRLLTVTRAGERAAAQVYAFRWNAALLEQAAQARHEGEILFWARGYGSLAEADRLLQNAEALYRKALTQADGVQHGLHALDEAMAFLPAYARYLDAAPQHLQTWQDAVLAARALYPLVRPAGAAPAGDLALIQDKTEVLRRSFLVLRQPFAADRLAQLVRRSRLPRPELAVLLEIDALLLTPFVPADDRPVLWLAARELERRLHRRNVDLDRDDDQLTQVTGAEGDFDRDRARQLEDATAERRAAVSLALLELAGLSGERLEPAHAALVKARRAAKEGKASWHALGQALRQAWARDLPAQLETAASPEAQDRLSRVLDPFDRVRALDEEPRTPAVRLQMQVEAALLAWLADRYRYQARDYHGSGLDTGLTSAESFYEQAARAYHPDFRPLPYAEMTTGPRLERLTPANPRGQALLKLRLADAGKAAASVPLRVLLADPVWLKVMPESAAVRTSAEDTEAVRMAEVPLEVELKPGGESARVPPPQGFLVQARVGERTFHRKVEVPLYATADRLQLVLSANPNTPEPAVGEIRLRPGQVRQPYYLYVRNVTAKPRKVIVEMKTGNPLAEAVAVGVVVPPGDSVQVPLGKALEKFPAELPEFLGPLTFRLLDADTREVLDARGYRVDVANPREYVRLSGARFTPGNARNEYDHKLMVELVVTVPPGGPDILAELVLPRARIPGLLAAPAGVFRGKLSAARTPVPIPLRLSATKLKLAEGAEEEGVVYVNVDGYERTFVLRTTFARRGDPTTPRADARPAVRLRTDNVLRGGADAGVTLEVDNAPDGATLEFTLGQLRGGEFLADLPPVKFAGAKRKRLGFTPQGPGGALLFEASVRDWVTPLDTAKVLGRRDLRARLLDADGRAIAQALQTITVADGPPERVRLVDMPRKAMRGTLLSVKAMGRDDEAGIKDVLFFVGRPVDKKLPPNTPTVTGMPLDAGGRTWGARLPLPGDRKGPTDVSVQFINRAGLSTFDTVTVELTETDPAKTGPGKIRGRVFEGLRPQADLHVVLTDEKNKEKARTKSKADGTFEFAEVAPGKYRVWSFKPEAQRRGYEPAVVEANRTTTVRVSLTLRP